MVSQLKRLERLEEAFRRGSILRRSSDCICFPEKASPCFLYLPLYDIGAAVKCPIHGERSLPGRPNPLFLTETQREVEVGLRWPIATEQYRKAWNATFQNDSWPAEEVEIAGRKWLLPRSETGELVDYVTAQTAPPWKRVKMYSLDETR